tara:strand:+ start:208 stop:558 length:351 start_codon:yes stop_codon:yes gene_type:complete
MEWERLLIIIGIFFPFIWVMLWLALTQWTNIVSEYSLFGKILWIPLLITFCGVLGWMGTMFVLERWKTSGLFAQLGYGFVGLFLISMPLYYLYELYKAVEEWLEERKEKKKHKRLK